ncbi:MAG: linear amide C-N hydrolase [Chloroflexota bacterium]
MNRQLTRIIHLLVIGLVSACTASVPQATSTPVPVTPTAIATVTEANGYTGDAVKTLTTLKKVSDYPLYTIMYYGEYDSRRPLVVLPDPRAESTPGWACSLFTVLLDEEHMLYGRNFDWQFSPALLLFTDPPDGYASVSMVDLEYLEFAEDTVYGLTDLPLEEQVNLLDAPWLPFDGMNEHGLAIGMAAVDPGNMQVDPAKKRIHSLGIIREVLDHARDVDEALRLFEEYNIQFGGPPLHYLIADAKGKAVLVEFYRGEMHVFENSQPWHSATNFLLSAVKDPKDGHCWRYDRINVRLNEGQGLLDWTAAMDLLAEVSQTNTQWSIVYQMARGEVNIAMGKDYENIQTFTISEYTPER